MLGVWQGCALKAGGRVLRPMVDLKLLNVLVFFGASDFVGIDSLRRKNRRK